MTQRLKFRLLLAGLMAMGASAIGFAYGIKDLMLLFQSDRVWPLPESRDLPLAIAPALALASTSVAAHMPHRHWLRFAILCTWSAAAWLILGKLNGTGQLPGAPVDTWLFLLIPLAVALEGLMPRRRVAPPLVSIVAGAFLWVACVTAAAVRVMLAILYGQAPLDGPILSLPATVLMLLLSTSLALQLRHAYARQATREDRPDLLIFERQVALLLTTGTAAGLLGAGAMAYSLTSAGRIPAQTLDQLVPALIRPLQWAPLTWSLVCVLAALWGYWRQLPALRKLRLARSQWAAMFGQMKQPLLTLDDAQRILSVNREALNLTGYSEAELLGQAVTWIIPQWTSPQARPAHPADDPSGQDAASLHRRDGSQIPVDAQLTRFEFERQTRYVLTLHDLRPAIRMQEDMRRRERIFHQAGWGIVVSSAGEAPALQQVNPAYAAMLGYAPDELIGQDIGKVVAPQNWPALMAARRRTEITGHDRSEQRHVHKDGRILPTLVDMSLVRDEQGRAQYFVVSVQDIAHIKLAEEQLRRSEARLQAVLEALPVGVWIGGPDGRIEKTNPAVQTLWGKLAQARPENPDARPTWWLDRQWPGQGGDPLLRRAVVTGQPVQAGVLTLTDTDGEQRTVVCSARPLRDELGQINGAVAVDEDVTALRRSEVALLHLNETLERMLETSPVGMAVCDARGVVNRTNTSWRTLLGTSWMQAGTEVIDALLEPGDTLQGSGLIERMSMAYVPPYVGQHRMRRANHAYAWTTLIVARLPGSPTQVLVQVLDVDAQRRNLNELINSQHRLASAQRLAAMGDWFWSVSTDEVECSVQTLELLGLSGQGPRGLTMARLLGHVHPDDALRIRAEAERLARHAVAADEDMRWIRPDGEVRDMRVQAVTRVGADGNTVSGTVQDVTDRKQIERALRDSRQKLQDLVAYEGKAIEEERKRIAREVHDELGQLLTAIRMDLSMLRKALAPDPALIQRIDDMRETVDTTMNVVRHVASNLRPSALDLGLIAAIEWLAEDFSHRWELACEVKAPHDDEIRLAEPTNLALFRVVQESLTNIARHARATQVDIDIRVRPGHLLLSVIDNGVGFDPLQAGPGLGLLGMQERMRAIGAALNIDSSPAGTTVNIVYALAQEKSRTPEHASLEDHHRG